MLSIQGIECWLNFILPEFLVCLGVCAFFAIWLPIIVNHGLVSILVRIIFGWQGILLVLLFAELLQF